MALLFLKMKAGGRPAPPIGDVADPIVLEGQLVVERGPFEEGDSEFSPESRLELAVDELDRIEVLDPEFLQGPHHLAEVPSKMELIARMADAAARDLHQIHQELLRRRPRKMQMRR